MTIIPRLARKKILPTFLSVLISASGFCPPGVAEAAVSPQIAEFLCERGITYFNREDFGPALATFKKALMADPRSETARCYIQKIEAAQMLAESYADQASSQAPAFQARLLGERETSAAVSSQPPKGKRASRKMTKDLKRSLQEIERAVLLEKNIIGVAAPKAPGAAKKVKSRGLLSPFYIESAPQVPELEPPQEILVDFSTLQKKNGTYEVEASVDDRLTFRARNIKRFVATEPGRISMTRQEDATLLVEPKEIGTAYLSFWDDDGRKDVRINISPRRFPEAVTGALRQKMFEAEQPQPFIVGYSIESDSYLTGRGLGDIERRSHSMWYTLSLKGETPYGKFDAATQATQTREGYFIPNLRMALLDSHYGIWKDIDTRVFDYSLAFSAFNFPISDLRGVTTEATTKDGRLTLTPFWGALPEGNFTFVPTNKGLATTKEAWLEGVGVNYRLGDAANIKSYYVHSYGSELIQPVLTNDSAGMGVDYYLQHWKVGAEAATDTRTVSYTARTSWDLPRLHLGLNATQNDKNYASLLGGLPASGNTTGTFDATWKPWDDVMISNVFSADRDKVFGNPARPNRPNYNDTVRYTWYLDSQSQLELGYAIDDRIGSNTPSKTETKDLSYRKQFFLIRRLATFLTYQNSKSKNYTSPAQDFNNNRILAGLSFRVISELYFYYHREINILYNKFSRQRAMPLAQEYGLNFYRRIFDWPFYGRFRLFYRDEQNTESTLSYLSGEDRLEVEGEITYRPNPDTETFLKLRVDNVWAERTGVTKHFDVDVNWGVRLLWDTGWRWYPRGSFIGYVFNDINADGIRQSAERGVAGVKITTSQGQTCVTDAQGFYKIARVSGKRMTLEIDVKSIPKGYGPTSSTIQDVEVLNAASRRVDFGIMTRTEIAGLVFLDKNKNGTYDPGVDEPVKGVLLTCDGKQKIVSSLLGEYMFRKIAPGPHLIALDLKTIPIDYIPKVPVKKSVTAAEGATFNYNIPLELSSQ